MSLHEAIHNAAASATTGVVDFLNRMIGQEPPMPAEREQAEDKSKDLLEPIFISSRDTNPSKTIRKRDPYLHTEDSEKAPYSCLHPPGKAHSPVSSQNRKDYNVRWRWRWRWR
ncbi:hypothetical protein N7466_001921 [Penicillium verhagenii]|uniref:uncharacterized protein n=1 Tax=Penicillium verhagenii TaxID=1562060 RepID=UPI002544F637|nr:uncharacterized protein N7466_001921 [Penicillium verhagenii]KAJ5938787.1 hypothetical protein N7466_001921 [Penicillium verhagenii]